VNTRKLHVIYILPSRYDDDGYVRRYWRGVLPSNTLACLKSLTLDLARSGELGPGVDVSVEIYDETVQRLPLRKIIRRHRRGGAQVLVGLAGVQSNQFPRARDIALQLRAEGVPVMIGGFHVSGILSMFDRPSPELQDVMDKGVTLVRGEAESPGVLAGILRDALNGELKPLYDITPPPDIRDAAVPQPDSDYLRRFVFKNMGTIDTSRGCLFNCSFCTIINVQGRKMRCRSADAILRSIESNYDRGINVYFFTDDNLARSPVWEEVFAGLAKMRDAGRQVKFMMQVDTQAWKIPAFLEKAKAAGCYLVFVGMESVNPANLASVGKRQNKTGEFAEMVAAWHKASILVHVGYIIGFAHDTVESVRRDVAVLKDEIKVDEASFFMLTPLPGSRDHHDMVVNRVPMDADLNNFDSFHETYRHNILAPGQWYALYCEAWDAFYGKEHLVDILLRTPHDKYWQVFWLSLWNRYASLQGSHPMVTGWVRFKARKDRRPEFPRESVPRYAVRRLKDWFHFAQLLVRLFYEFQEIWLLTRRQDDPRWKTLAELRLRWAEARSRIGEFDVAGRRDAAVGELRNVLQTASDRLTALSERRKTLSHRAQRRIQTKVQEIDNYIRAFDVPAPTWQQVVQAERYVSEGLLAGYEDLAIRYVAQRRRFNAYRRDCWERIKTGRILTLNLSPIPRLLLFELFVGLRFGFNFLARF
jgi:radical SAM superfamily enzyme YgiQ (UPF0313 family)